MTADPTQRSERQRFYAILLGVAIVVIFFGVLEVFPVNSIRTDR